MLRFQFIFRRCIILHMFRAILFPVELSIYRYTVNTKNQTQLIYLHNNNNKSKIMTSDCVFIDYFFHSQKRSITKSLARENLNEAIL